MCSCTDHQWLARPVDPHPGDQAVAGTTTERTGAIGAGLAAALELYDRRALLGNHSPVVIEVSVDTEVIGWVPITPVDAHLPDRDGVVSALEALHGRLIGTDWWTPLPPLNDTALRVDLDLAPHTGDVTGDRVPRDPGPSTWS